MECSKLFFGGMTTSVYIVNGWDEIVMPYAASNV